MKNKFAIITIALIAIFAGCIKTGAPEKKFKTGVNGFHWVPADSIRGFDVIRLYAEYSWFSASEGKFKFQPGYGGNANYDTYLKSCKDAGIEPVLCVHNSPEWLIGKGVDPQSAPVRPGESLDSPNSYRYMGDMFFQIAARYGRNLWPREALLIDTTERWTNEGKNTIRTGLNLLNYVEVWNEPDKFWKRGTRAYFEPEQYAAMLSVCYDQVKRADESMKVVMGGITEMDTVYVGRMAVWFYNNRHDKKFAADVINFHHYQNVSKSKNTGEWLRGASPEEDSTEAKIRAFTAFLKRIVPGIPVWWSEFGYDSNPYSKHTAPADSIGPWIERSYGAAEKTGCEAAFLFNSIDELGGGEYVFGSCGLMGHPGSFERMRPKPHYKYLKQNILKK